MAYRNSIQKEFSGGISMRAKWKKKRRRRLKRKLKRKKERHK